MRLGWLLDRLLNGDVVDGTDVARVLGTSPRSVTRWQSAAVSRGATPRSACWS